jgi:hypothetical protein
MLSSSSPPIVGWLTFSIDAELSVFLGTHFPIALYAIEHGLHVLITKPATQKLEHHNTLIEAAKKKGVVCWVEHHKR